MIVFKHTSSAWKYHDKPKGHSKSDDEPCFSRIVVLKYPWMNEYDVAVTKDGENLYYCIDCCQVGVRDKRDT